MERLSGLLPPMVGIWKRIGARRGVTRLGPFPVWPFGVEGRGDGFALVYRPPFSGFVDEVRAAPDGSWLGRSLLGGREIGRFRMRRMGASGRPRATEGESTMEADRLRGKLIEYVEYVHALEQNVLLQLDSLILNTGDPELKGLFRRHKEETRRQLQRLHDRRVALSRGPRLAAVGKDLAAIATAQVKGVGDILRPDKGVQNARDAFATEHVEIASYEILERLAERAGDPETAQVARESRAEEQAMAARIAENWDRFLDLTLEEQGLGTRA